MIALGLQKLKESSIECFPLLLTKRKAGRKRSVIPRRKHWIRAASETTILLVVVRCFFFSYFFYL